MFGTIGGPELVLILVIALIIFGPRKLPEIGKSVGKMVVEFRNASSEFQRTISSEIEAETRKAPPAPPVLAEAPAPPIVSPAPGIVPQTAEPPTPPKA